MELNCTPVVNYLKDQLVHKKKPLQRAIQNTYNYWKAMYDIPEEELAEDGARSLLSMTAHQILVRLRVSSFMARHDEVVELRKHGLTYAEIGRRLGVNRERVRQIAKEPAKVMLTTSEVAHFLGVHPNTVRHWSEKGILKSYRIRQRGHRRFSLENVNGFLKEGES